MSESAAPADPLNEIGPGRLLAQLRGQRNLSVADVAQRLKYGVRQIEALEAEEFARLPGTTFMRGMIRGYAKLLEIDPEPVLKALERRYIPGVATVDLRAKRVPFPDGSKKRGTRAYLALSAVALVGVAIVLYEWRVGALLLPGSGGTPPRTIAKVKTEPPVVETAEVATTAPAAPASRSLPAEKPAQAPAPASVSMAVTPVKDVKRLKAQGQGPGRIFLEFAEDSWVEIRDSDGKTLMAQLNLGGSRRLVAGQPPFSLVIGNAASVRVMYNDAPVDLKPHVKVEVARLTLE